MSPSCLELFAQCRQKEDNKQKAPRDVGARQSPMKGRLKSIAALGVSGLAGLLVASLALAGSPGIVESGHDHAGAVPSDASQSAFYSEMAKVNARMHEAMDVA